MTLSQISPSQLKNKLEQSDCVLIDVRTPAEYQTVHVKQAKSVPLDRLDPDWVANELEGRKDREILVICQKGGRGKQGCEKLLSAGFTNVHNVEGGTEACLQSGLPVVRGRETMSLERQVRIVAGALVLTGTLLAAFVHPGFLGLTGFVGAGLIFAGVTDLCLMANLLGKLPWNRRGAESCSLR